MEVSVPVPVILNLVASAIGLLLSSTLAVASVISLANMRVPWVVALLVAALLMPVMFLVSGIGTWVAYERASRPVVIGLMALPWLYALLFVVAMLISFEQ